MLFRSVVQQGRGEFIEKYAVEVVGELLDRGYAVQALDWRGQGLSERPLADPDKGHIDDFATYLDDFQAFMSEVVAPAAPAAAMTRPGRRRTTSRRCRRGSTRRPTC